MGFEIIATKGTGKVLSSNEIIATVVGKIEDGDNRILELIKKGDIKLIINTPSGKRGHSDMKLIRNLAVMHGVSCITTLQGAQAAVNGIESMLKGPPLSVKPIQKYIA
jgi:carbamoyl-phosphate synthase large subunit